MRAKKIVEAFSAQNVSYNRDSHQCHIIEESLVEKGTNLCSSNQNQQVPNM